jgi:hypothetical protein
MAGLWFPKTSPANVDIHPGMFLLSQIMQSFRTRCIHVVLALAVFSAAVTPACAGGENCGMPCCRQSPVLASDHPTGVQPQACCPRAAHTSSDIGASCRSENSSLALNAENRLASATTTTSLAPISYLPAQGLALTNSRPDETLQPFKDPLYLRIQILRI